MPEFTFEELLDHYGTKRAQSDPELAATDAAFWTAGETYERVQRTALRSLANAPASSSTSCANSQLPRTDTAKTRRVHHLTGPHPVACGASRPNLRSIA